jgi:hypothetical protein
MTGYPLRRAGGGFTAQESRVINHAAPHVRVSKGSASDSSGKRERRILRNHQDQSRVVTLHVVPTTISPSIPKVMIPR